MNHALRVIPILLALLWAGQSVARSATWTLIDVAFEDGGRAYGSFDFDADSRTFTDWLIYIEGGDEVTFPPATMVPTNSAAFIHSVNLYPTYFFYIEWPFPYRELRLTTLEELTNRGGSVDLSLPDTIDCHSCNPFRRAVSGRLIGVPEPSSVSLNCIAMLTLFACRRLKRHSLSREPD